MRQSDLGAESEAAVLYDGIDHSERNICGKECVIRVIEILEPVNGGGGYCSM
jgi:hypothetical protein